MGNNKEWSKVERIDVGMDGVYVQLNNEEQITIPATTNFRDFQKQLDEYKLTPDDKKEITEKYIRLRTKELAKNIKGDGGSRPYVLDAKDLEEIMLFSGNEKFSYNYANFNGMAEQLRDNQSIFRGYNDLEVLKKAAEIDPNLDDAIVNTIFWGETITRDADRLNKAFESDGISLSDVNEIAISTGRENIRERGSDQIGSAEQMLQRIKKLEDRTILIGGERKSAIELASQDVQLEVEAMKVFLKSEEAKGLKGEELEQAWEQSRGEKIGSIIDQQNYQPVDIDEIVVTASRIEKTKNAGMNTRFENKTWQVQNSLSDMGLGDMLGNFASVDENGKKTGEKTGIDGIEGPMTRAAIEESKKRLNNLFQGTEITFDENSEITEEYLNTVTNFSKLKNASELIAQGDLSEEQQKQMLKDLEAQYKNSQLAEVLKDQGINPFDKDGLNKDEIDKMSVLAANFGKGGNGMSVAG